MNIPSNLIFPLGSTILFETKDVTVSFPETPAFIPFKIAFKDKNSLLNKFSRDIFSKIFEYISHDHALLSAASLVCHEWGIIATNARCQYYIKTLIFKKIERVSQALLEYNAYQSLQDEMLISGNPTNFLAELIIRKALRKKIFLELMILVLKKIEYVRPHLTVEALEPCRKQYLKVKCSSSYFFTDTIFHLADGKVDEVRSFPSFYWHEKG